MPVEVWTGVASASAAESLGAAMHLEFPRSPRHHRRDAPTGGTMMDEKGEPLLRFSFTSGDTVVEITAPAAVTVLSGADSIDRLIADLLQVRAQLAPPHPDRPPRTPGSSIPVAERWWVSPQPTGGVVLCSMHRGLGWLALPLPAESARNLVTTISSYLATPAAGTSS